MGTKNRERDELPHALVVRFTEAMDQEISNFREATGCTSMGEAVRHLVAMGLVLWRRNLVWEPLDDQSGVEKKL